MTASVASFLTQAQKQGSELPPPLSGALLLAALRLSDRKQQALFLSLAIRANVAVAAMGLQAL